MSQSNPDLSLTEILWEDLRRAVQMPTNLNELKQSWNKEWARIPPPWCERLIKLPRVIAAKGSSDSQVDTCLIFFYSLLLEVKLF